MVKRQKWTRRKKTSALSTTPRWEQYLKEIYFNPRHPASFKGPHKLYQAVKEEGRHAISLKQIQHWLQNQESYSLNKPLRRSFRRLKVIVTGKYDQYEADLADMQKLAC